MNLNISLIGDSAVGKTSIANAMAQIRFSTEYEPTIGASMVKIPFEKDQQKYNFVIWDTAGMEKYKSLAPVYYRDSKASIIVFDLNSIETLEHVSEWLNLYQSIAGENNPILLIGNKLDLAEDPSEIRNQAEKWISEHSATYIEVSAKNCTNIDEILPLLFNIMVKAGLSLSPSKKQRRKTKSERGCCS
ncbi:small GTP-binding protein, putative [Trichomonas vaginalis G3]|uniref:Small GTP-binding protein, putative n=1 Tax=Trichomonas vaginalis (strain ATCC PRA-98 / G3) TaxID=412133 RepID=A2DI65_TRIV3|nr:GTPase protein [Trichomonas vaginalis G3]EAY19861.1 small GTP-binding protein, putative [Trichomonas vaginalis G3]KAI5510010.1 GTPase protein [Trichomonas vaginalis G3]|eukprot:XP_001580847.1 small GTP-binding protein [Trichomonas vaginalis G3]